MAKTNIQIPYNFTPRSYQLELFKALDGQQGKPETRKRRAILRWHRRAGKDKCCWCYLLKEAAQNPGNYFYIFPTKTMSRQALWENIDKDGFKLINHMPKEFISRLSNQEMLIETMTGSTIRVLGYDKDPDSIRGVACKGVVFSEFAFSDPESYKIMMPAIRESNGWAIFNSTPNGRNHFSDMWDNVYTSHNWFVSLLQTYWPTEEGYSGLINIDQMKQIQEEEGLSDEDVEREYGCSFNSGMKGSIYLDHIEKARNSGRVGNFPYDDSKPVDTFWDLGRDGCAIWFRQKSGNAIFFIDYWEMEKGDVTEFVKELKNKGYEYKTHYVPHDADNKSIQTGNSTARILESTLRDYGLSDEVITLNKSPLQHGIDTTKKRFSRYHFDKENCRDALKHLDLYHKRFDKKRMVFIQEPVHDQNSHCADALRTEAMSEDIENDYFYRLNNIKVDWEFDPLA